ncbi:MAG: aspartate--ammonia ligase [Clostridiales bacterium]|uniref:aspartate--ammonia ligase n=1 Tax=Clostridium sp. N3C TaxID=1776758 RepID=UPI00092E1D2D|nr:aspartate--ammonia ligase [Clostridium sp. N3C]NLZ47561.1 aspartate--ammonia ligase [Clostridiales bacterium]SCN22615.1 Aspartate-ammonia ligase [Clostridium sp. N3C]
MAKITIPEGYKPLLNLYETQTAIGKLKRTFEDNLSKALNLKRVSAPLFVDPKTGLNDNLNGIERPVSFDIKETETIAEVVHSLAKWKRMALYTYGFSAGEGLYTDMNAIRRDEEMDELHSVYVDQWDWEKVISKENRNVEYLKETVKLIVNAVCDTLDEVKKEFPQIPVILSREVSFVTTQELEDLYPTVSPKERENLYLKEHKTAFIMQIGDKLKSGEKHDGRSPDYDDWQLNGDIVFWNDLLGKAFEVSSMGIRVDAKSLDEQLTKAGCDDRRELPFHKMLLNGELPLTMGGGIGQSRLCMLLLAKAHIGEVQASIWDSQTYESCEKAGIKLL